MAGGGRKGGKGGSCPKKGGERGTGGGGEREGKRGEMGTRGPAKKGGRKMGRRGDEKKGEGGKKGGGVRVLVRVWEVFSFGGGGASFVFCFFFFFGGGVRIRVRAGGPTGGGGSGSGSGSARVPYVLFGSWVKSEILTKSSLHHHPLYLKVHVSVLLAVIERACDRRYDPLSLHRIPRLGYISWWILGHGARPLQSWS